MEPKPTWQSWEQEVIKTIKAEREAAEKRGYEKGVLESHMQFGDTVGELRAEIELAHLAAVESFAEKLKKTIPDFVAINPPITTTNSFMNTHVVIDQLVKEERGK